MVKEAQLLANTKAGTTLSPAMLEGFAAGLAPMYTRVFAFLLAFTLVTAVSAATGDPSNEEVDHDAIVLPAGPTTIRIGTFE